MQIDLKFVFLYAALMLPTSAMLSSSRKQGPGAIDLEDYSRSSDGRNSVYSQVASPGPASFKGQASRNPLQALSSRFKRIGKPLQTLRNRFRGMGNRLQALRNRVRGMGNPWQALQKRLKLKGKQNLVDTQHQRSSIISQGPQSGQFDAHPTKNDMNTQGRRSTVPSDMGWFDPGSPTAGEWKIIHQTDRQNQQSQTGIPNYGSPGGSRAHRRDGPNLVIMKNSYRPNVASQGLRDPGLRNRRGVQLDLQTQTQNAFRQSFGQHSLDLESPTTRAQHNILHMAALRDYANYDRDVAFRQFPESPVRGRRSTVLIHVDEKEPLFPQNLMPELQSPVEYHGDPAPEDLQKKFLGEYAPGQPYFL